MFRLALLAAAVIAAPAAALTIHNVDVQGGGRTTITTPHVGSQTVLAGGVALDDLLGFCADVYHEISEGGGQALAYDVLPNATFLQTDFGGNALSQDQVDRMTALVTFGNRATVAQRGAIQQAIWTIEDPNKTFTANAGFTQADVNSWVSRSVGKFGHARLIKSLDGHQSFLVAGVPEPATWAMMLIGFVLVGVLRRRPVAVDRLTPSKESTR